MRGAMGEEPYTGYEHPVAGGTVNHRVLPARGTVRLTVPPSGAELTPEQVVRLATTLLRDAMLLRHGEG